MDKKNTKKPSFLFIGRSDEPILSKKNRKLLTDPLDDSCNDYVSNFCNGM